MKPRLSERKQKILKAVVDEYIRSALPISSGEIKSKHFASISSATIRAELSTLEDMGYLMQPHTSAGRVPTPLAYKLYAENFLDKKPLSKSELSLISNSFSSRFSEVEDVVKATAKVISDITNYTSVIVLNDIKSVKLKEIKLVGLDEHQALVIIITDSGIIKDKVITLQREINHNYLRDATSLLNNVFYGKTVAELKASEAALADQLSDYRDLFDSIIEIFIAQAADDSSVIFEGASKFLEHPDQDIESTKGFLSLMDGKHNIKSLIEEDADIEFSVKVGRDEQGTGLDKCAVVTAKYSLRGKEIGHAGVIGPARMDYAKVMSVLSHIKKTLNIIAEPAAIDKNKEKKNDKK